MIALDDWNGAKAVVMNLKMKRVFIKIYAQLKEPIGEEHF